MRSIVTLVIVAACSSKTVVRETTVRVDDPPPEPSGPEPTLHEPAVAVEAPHAGAIQAVALSPDGASALTVDELGGARLWPTLDGTQEPRVVELPFAKQLALAPHATGFTAVVLDEVGGLYVAKLDREGRTLSHTTHGIDPAFAGVAMTATGVLAWRTDHRLLRLDAAGVVLESLGTEPQQRVVNLAVAGSRAVAIIDRAGTHAMRWLELQPRLAWGAWIEPGLKETIRSAVALSPDHKHVAVELELPRRSRIAVVETATKKIVTTRDVAAPSVELRFADDALVAVASTHGLAWIAVAEGSPSAPLVGSPNMPQARQRELIAAGGGRAVLPSNGELMLITPAETKFLGYETLAPRVAEAGPNGQLLVGMGSSVHLLDASLKSVATPPMVTSGNALARTPLAEMEWVGGDEWLVESVRIDGKVDVALVNGVSGLTSVVRELREVHVLAFERSTGLAALSFGNAAEVAKLDLKGRTLDRIASVAKLTPYEQVLFVPVAPKLARGTELIQVTMRDRPTIKWLPDARGLDKPSATLTLDGAYVGADAAGRVYAWRPRPADAALELVVLTDGKQTATLPTVGPATLWPDAAGARIVEVGPAAVTMYEPTGKVVWSQNIASAHEAIWLTDGGLVLTHASGVARLDPANGKVTAARCGWGFGLSRKPHPIAPRIEPICAQLGR